MRAITGFVFFFTGLLGLGAAGGTVLILLVYRTATDGWDNDLFLLLVSLLTILWSLSSLVRGIRMLRSSIDSEQQEYSGEEKDSSSARKVE